MTPGVLIGIAALGGVGAVARFLLDGGVSARAARTFPYGTLAVNLLGAFLFGVLIGARPSSHVESLVGTGLIGAFTTFSTWALESHRLGEDGRLGAGAANLIVSLALGIAVAWAGRRLGLAL